MRITRLLVFALVATLSTVVLVRWLYTKSPSAILKSSLDSVPGWSQSHDPNNSRITIVAASQLKDNTTWLSHFPEWEKRIYITDSPSASLTVPINKGREGQVFLTYIIDHYASLPDVIIFSHADRYQWHNDDPLYDGQRMLSRLQTPYITQQGYVNLRCVHTLGCPVEIRPYSEVHTSEKDWKASDAVSGRYYLDAFRQLFPDIGAVPEEIGVSCCAQFAVAGWRVRERPKEDYERFRKWLTETELGDNLSGRIMEYSWHIIFGEKAIHCPNAAECYCKTYGLCNLSCENEGVCKSQYTLPKYSYMPKGWPDYDWDEKWRDIPELRAQQELDYTPNVLNFSG